MKNIKTIKGFVAGLIVGFGLLSLGTYAATTQSGTIGELFLKITSTVGDDLIGTYRLMGDNIEDETIDESELESDSVGNDELINSENYTIGNILKLDSNTIYSDNNTALGYISNNDTYTQFILKDKQEDIYGRVYGNGNGANFGLLDGDSEWSYLAAKDNYTQFRISNDPKMHISSNGNVGIGTTNPQAKLHVNGKIRATTPIASDSGNTVATKDYVDNKPAVTSYTELPSGSLAGRCVVKDFIVYDAILPGKDVGFNCGCVSGWSPLLLSIVADAYVYTCIKP